MKLLNVTRTLSPTEILALHSTPIELLPAKPGVVYVPFYVSFYKGAGTGYTATDIILESTDGVEFAPVQGDTFFTQTAESAFAQKVLGGSIDSLGLAIQLRLASATTGGDQPIKVKLVYMEEYPGLAD